MFRKFRIAILSFSLLAGTFSLVLLPLGIFGATQSVSAHEGHDHGPEPTTANAAASPRIVADSEAFQFVGVVEGEVLVMYLDRAADNAPVTGATVEVTLGSDILKAELQPNGTYEVTSKLLRQPGETEILVSIQDGQVSDLLVGAVRIRAPAMMAPMMGGIASIRDVLGKLPLKDLGIPGLENRPEILLLGLPLVAGILLGALIRSKPRAAAVVVLGAVLAFFASSSAIAHEGHDHGETSAAASNGNAPARRADGTIFLPKVTQRLLEIRTRIVEPEMTQRAVRFVGRVIANPNRSGVVQSTIQGRIMAAPSGLPKLGQTVKAGEILGFVTPSFASIDATTVQQTAGDLEQQIMLAQTRVERLRRLTAADIASRASLEEAEILLRGLQRRREELRQSQTRPEPLRAPVDGVIAEFKIVPGQVVATTDVLFQIVDPTAFWVEALVYDQANPDTIKVATATTVNHHSLDLVFVGRSRALQQQATVLQFEIKGSPENLDVGTPVTVSARTGATVTGIILPRSALAQAPNGQWVVFHHRDAETFVPKPVRVETLDNDRVLVLGGVGKGDKIVVQNAPLLNQVR